MPNTEPVLNANIIVAIVSAVVVLGASFGLPLTDEQKAAIIGVTVVLAPLIAAWWARSHVTPLADPKVETEAGELVSLIRADTGRSTPQAIAAGNEV